MFKYCSAIKQHENSPLQERSLVSRLYSHYLIRSLLSMYFKILKAGILHNGFQQLTVVSIFFFLMDKRQIQKAIVVRTILTAFSCLPFSPTFSNGYTHKPADHTKSYGTDMPESFLGSVLLFWKPGSELRVIPMQKGNKEMTNAEMNHTASWTID